ncbi:MAG: hypothetical protein GX330_02560, partial [Bacteroidales bacterium]|nr:hypothetical protein [Bacteroidales bacterium]
MKKILSIGIILLISIHVFSQRLSGTYYIGSGGNYASISAAMNALLNNGVSGNVTFKINNGSYPMVNLNFLSGVPNQGDNDTIRFTSSSHNANNVIISSTSTALLINNAKNLIVDNLTIGDNNTTKGIEITGSCNNLEIKDCNINSNPTGNSNAQAGIYFDSRNNTSAYNLRILNNHINGGYYSIYLYGYSSNNYNTNIVIDNNNLSNPYVYGIYSYYTSFNSISKNTITSRSSNNSSSFYGTYIYYSNADMINGNKVQSLTTAVAYPYGMMFSYLNYRNTTTPSLISNNEILVFTNSSYYGMYLNYSRANVYNNSILVGGNGPARALYVNMLAGVPVNIRNNNLHAMAPSAYPIYITSNSVAYSGTHLKMDYNNYYNQTQVGFAGTNITDLNDWRFVTKQDAHSISVYPNYTDLFSYRLIADGEGFNCPRIPNVNSDIRDTLRQSITSMGAYHSYIPKMHDIKLLNLISPTKDVTAGVPTPVRVSIMNMGYNPVDSINIYWNVNGNLQTYLWTGFPLALGDSTPIITLGNFIPLPGENNITVYTSLVGGKIDNDPLNDTVSIHSFGCKTTVNSIYTVGGSSADFKTITEAIDVIKYCGIHTPTTISINPGTYNENIIIPAIKGTNSTNTLTITSTSGDSSSVTIQSLTSAPAITLTNTDNVIINKITVKGTSLGLSSTAIRLQNNNRNITISNNYLVVSPNSPSTASSTDIMAIISQTSSDTNLVISNNYIDGSGGIYIRSENS